MTNQQYYDEYINNTADTLKQLTNQDIIKLVLEDYRNFIISYDIDRQQADYYGMSIVEYHNCIVVDMQQYQADSQELIDNMNEGL